MEKLKKLLDEIDGRGYKAYKQLQGEYQFAEFLFRIDHVQGDPFADPSRCRVFIKAAKIKLSEVLYCNAIRRIALEDFLGRRFFQAINQHVKGNRGSGKSGEMTIASYGQQVLQRNAVLISEGKVEVRFRIALPADGRSVNANQAKQMLFDELPEVIEAALLSVNSDTAAMQAHVDSVEDQDYLRQQLNGNGLVAFVADGACLPRLSGINDRPLTDAVLFRAPDSLAVELKSLHGRPIRGLGVTRGVTLIVGGGYHGKSTLLHALERGVYNHIPGDGREKVVTDPDAIKIRAEDGRAITGVNISPFISNLPQAKDTANFSSQNASGSTSQAANIIEALATGSKTLLIDEDTSATNFMIRDEQMQALVAKEKEPITPLVQRIQEMSHLQSISTVLVMGGSGDYFAVADTIIMMDNYVPKDVSHEAKTLAKPPAPSEAGPLKIEYQRRKPNMDSLSCETLPGKEKIQAFSTRAIRYGNQEIDLSRIEQLVDNAQLQAIGYLLRYYTKQYAPQRLDLVEGLQLALDEVETNGLDRITPFIIGSLAMPRIQELVAAANRMRNLTLIEKNA